MSKIAFCVHKLIKYIDSNYIEKKKVNILSINIKRINIILH